MSKKAAAATQMFHGYNIENQRHGINKDYLPNNTLSFFGNYRDDKSALSFTQSQCLKIAKKDSHSRRLRVDYFGNLG